MILLTSHDFVIVIVIVLSLEPKTTTPRTQNKRSADQLILRWRACTAGVARREETVFSTHALPFNNRSTYDGQF
jgi:hypothetical protein